MPQLITTLELFPIMQQAEVELHLKEMAHTILHYIIEWILEHPEMGLLVLKDHSKMQLIQETIIQ
jgi:hypothetical protein